jgi:hypothetical protein
VLATPTGAELYRKRTAMIEPVFGDTKFNRKIDRFQRQSRLPLGMAADHDHPQPPGMNLRGEGSGGAVRARS